MRETDSRCVKPVAVPLPGGLLDFPGYDGGPSPTMRWSLGESVEMCFGRTRDCENEISSAGPQVDLFASVPEERPFGLTLDLVRERYEVLRQIIQGGESAIPLLAWETSMGGALGVAHQLLEWAQFDDCWTILGSRFQCRLCVLWSRAYGYTPDSVMNMYFFRRVLQMQGVATDVVATFYLLVLHWLGLAGMRDRFSMEFGPYFYDLWVVIDEILDDDFGNSLQFLFDVEEEFDLE